LREEQTEKRVGLGKVLLGLLRYLSYALLIVTLYLSLATIGFSLVTVLPPYGPSVLAFSVIAAAISYLYLSNRAERKRAMKDLPLEEKAIFEDIKVSLLRIIEEGST